MACETLLFDILERTIDNRGKTPPISKSGFPLVEVKHIQNNRLYPVLADTKFVDQDTWDTWFRVHLEPGDILFSTVGSIARTCLVPASPVFGIAQNVLGFRVDKSKADPRYIYYAMHDSFFQQEVHGRTIETVQKSIKVHDLKTCRIRLPSLPEQRAIAHILGTLDDKIELNRRMNETMEKTARALFMSWFVDFDPVRAKAEGRETGLPKPIADLFPNSFDNSARGEIPKGWSVRSIADAAAINARTLGRNDPLEVIDYIEISEVMRGEVGNIVRYERGSEPSRARRRPRHGDTVLSTVRPDRGAYFLALNPPETLVASTGFTVLSPKDGNWAFLYCALTRSDVGEQLGRLADGGAYPAIRPEVVGNLPVVLPHPPTISAAFERLVRPLFERAAQNRAQSVTLATVRDILLPKLISGEIRIPQVERNLGG